MEAGEIINIVGQSCRPDQEQKLLQWYHEVHIPGLLQFKGLNKVYCCRRLDIGQTKYDSPVENYPKFVNIYEYRGLEAFKDYENWLLKGSNVGQDVRATWEKDPVERIWRVQYEIAKVLEAKR